MLIILLCKEAHKNPENTNNVNQDIIESTSSSCEDFSGTGDTCISPAGRLEMAYEKWKEITDDLYILEEIRKGYKLPIKESPPDILLKIIGQQGKTLLSC